MNDLPIRRVSPSDRPPSATDRQRDSYANALTKTLPNGSEQLTLFEAFAKDTPAAYTNILEFFDSIPKFSLATQTSVRAGKALEIAKYNFNWGDVPCRATIAPIVVESKDLNTEEPVRKEVIPGPREAALYRIIRKMASEEFADRRAKGEKVILRCTLYALRNRLAQVGHELKVSQIREALEVLGGAQLKVTNLATNKTVYSGSYIDLNYVADESDDTGSKFIVEIALSKLAVTAIVNRLYNRIHYERLMGLSLPLSAWIYELMTRNFRQAGADHGYRLSLSRVLRESGLPTHKDLRSNLRQVRRALAELTEKGVLASWPTPKEDVQLAEKTLGSKGRKSIKDVIWILFPSESVIADIRTDNAVKRAREENKGKSLPE